MPQMFPMPMLLLFVTTVVFMAICLVRLFWWEASPSRSETSEQNSKQTYFSKFLW